MLSPLVIGFQGTQFTTQQLDFFKQVNPYGLMIGRQNLVNKSQLSELIQAFRETVGRSDALVTTDQEGGRIQYLEGPEWQSYPIYGDFAALAKSNMEQAKQAVRLTSRAMASEMAAVGFNANCGPVLDLSVQGSDEVMSNRNFSSNPDVVSQLGDEVIKGHMESGLLPMIKHMPGHGRATEDSHKTRPVVECSLEELDNTDFLPFKNLSHSPIAMVAHVVYSAIDSLPATVSPTLVKEIIRGRLDYQNVLISDCIYMESLSGPLDQRCKQVQDAGVDLVLSCHGEVDDWWKWHAALKPLSTESLARLENAFNHLESMAKLPDRTPAKTMETVHQLLSK